MSIEYEHSHNLHTVGGASAALSVIFRDGVPKSVLDVGCGTGTWLRAAFERSVTDVYGIDGVEISPAKLLFEPECFKRCDLTLPIDLGRKFEMCLCLEVGEHLDAQFAPVLVKTLTRHADKIIFSAACPGQSGQHHVNCQWPEYWQDLFNKEAFVCEDILRWRMWPMKTIEPWYRQNLFCAHRNPEQAGKEPRILPVVHPEMWAMATSCDPADLRTEFIRQVEQGCMPTHWYFSTIFSGPFTKAKRWITNKNEK